jgi:Kef-type K+ transport system membrane component KefB
MGDFLQHILQQFRLPLSNPVLIFSVILFIILLSPLLLKRLNIPGIIVLIISGVIIGPHGFNVLAKNSAVDLFSTIGLLYIMFIAGLELDVNEFKQNKNKSLVFGIFTFSIPLAIGFPVVHFLLGYEFNAAFLTASMFATHTLVAYPIVSRMGVAKNQAVAITVGGTIFTDTAVLIILAIILANSQGSLNAEFWLRIGISMVIFLGVMFFIIPRVAAWFFNKLESEKHSHYIFVLAVVFFAAFLAEVAGVEAIIGAFVAGLALNKLIPHSSALMNRIEFIGNSLFIPFFLISVGMLVDVSVILDGPFALIIAGTLTVVAITGKWIAAWLTQKIFKYTRTQRQLIFGLSGAHAAATLAVILVGFNAGILDENILNGTVILILITCVVASFSTERAARAMLVGSENEVMSELANGSKVSNEHILLPIAKVESIDKLLEFSVLVKEKNSAHPISVLSVVTNDSDAETNVVKARAKLQEIVKKGSATETKVNVLTAIDQNASSGIARISKEVIADIIILMWPNKKKSLIEKMENVFSKVNKTLFFCDFEKPLALHKRVLLVVPPLAEHEIGFNLWFNKIGRLAQELSIPIHLYGNSATGKYIESFYKKSKFPASLNFNEFEDWDDILILSRFINENDLFILVSSRRDGISHMYFLDSLPNKLQKYFASNSKIIIYPQQNIQDYDSTNYEAPVEPLSKGLERIQWLGREIGNIFKKEN